MRYFLFIMLCCLLSNSSFASDCDKVAKIHLFAKIGHVSILRAGKKSRKPASKKNRYLCAGDKVIVPKIVSGVIVEYFTNPAKQDKLNADVTYKVGKLDKPCGKWCKLLAEIDYLYEQLIQSETSFVSNTQVFGRGEDGELLPIFMPLAIGEGSDYEFFLFAQAGSIPLFWHGGEPDYKLLVKDSTDKVVIDTTVKTNHYDLKLSSTNVGQRYELTVGCQACDKLYKKHLVFVAPVPLAYSIQGDAKLKALIGLLLDEDKNWRLEIWRQLGKLPSSPQRDALQQHLKWDDF